MATSITGNSSNVEINNSNIWVTASDKRVIAPRGEFTDSTLSLTTVGPTGIANAAPSAGHTLSVGANVYINDTAGSGNPVLKVHGLLEADSINFGSAGTPGAVFFADGSGALTTGDGGLSFTNASNTLTSNGPVVSLQGISLFKDTVANNTSIIGTLDATGAFNVFGAASNVSTLTANATTVYDGLTVASGTALVGTLVANATSVTTLEAHDTFNVFGAASNISTLTANATTVYDGLTVASGTALVGTLVANATSTTELLVNGGLTVADSQVALLKDTTANNTNIVGTLDVSEKTTLSGALEVTGTTLVATLTANATSVTSLETHGTFNVYGAESNVAGLTANATSIYDDLNVYAATPVFHNNLQVNGDLIVDGNLTVLSTQNLVVDDPLILLGNTNTNSGAVVDVGMFFRQPSGSSNVVTVFDADVGKYRIAKTTNGYTDTEITSFQDIEVLVTGKFEATTNVQAQTIAVNSGVLIVGNSIIFA